MKKNDVPIVKDLVLVGGGHSHVAVLKRFGMRPVPGVRLTVICRDVHTPYSGMLPGYVAGHYGFDEVHIDLEPLTRFAGARFFHDEAIGLDLAGKKVLCRGRPPVEYDVLSINIGATPRVHDVRGAEGNVVPVKPINSFIDRWERFVERVMATAGPHRIAVVGAGAGGVELTLAALYRLENIMSEQGRTAETLEFHIITDSATILPTHNARVRAKYSRVLAERGVHVHTGQKVVEVGNGGLRKADGSALEFDEILWVTAAGAAPWLAEAGLEVDEGGFLRVDDCLRVLGREDVFAAGDIATMVNHPREKAGVFAVRQGKPLAGNLRRALLGRRLRPFAPQKKFLSLISTGDKYAVAARAGWALEGAYVWRWKDWIDRRFMRKFSDLPEMDEDESPGIAAGLAEPSVIKEISAIAMRCGGCGAKVGSTVLTRALGQLEPVQRDDILIGLHEPDDAAVVEVPPGKVMVHSVDFFRSFIDDPYVFGQVAANHALGDLFAMGADPQSALAVAVVPFGVESKVEDALFQMMSGALKVLSESNTALVGGHTGEGAELSLGFAVNGLVDRERILKKGGMRPGDRIIITKGLGTGTLFAADMRLKAKGRWIVGALESMLLSNYKGAKILHGHGATACTDVTGFGLLGHLVEMTKPSEVDVELRLSEVPLLDGAIETVRQGIFSSLQPENVRLRRAIRDLDKVSNHETYPLIFDPQTAGGLLASVPAEKAEACRDALVEAGYAQTRIIGTVLPQGEALEPVTLIP